MVNAISTPDQNTLKVAVVVPTYNESETLPQLIEKVVAQGIDGLGFIVVDDGSPDGTGAIADGLADEFTGVFIAVSYTHLTLPTKA